MKSNKGDRKLFNEVRVPIIGLSKGHQNKSADKTEKSLSCISHIECHCTTYYKVINIMDNSKESNHTPSS